jgi:phosphopantetheinyl transferase
MHPCRLPAKPVKGAGAADQNRLISILVDHVAALNNPGWQYWHAVGSAALPILVEHDPLGRPRLLLAGQRGPAISFSEAGGTVWAALCGDGSEVGIDAASAGEFQGEYPVHRVFHDRELHHALRLTGGDAAGASALLWSIKEAAVKALGCAFHLVAPRQVQVSPVVSLEGGGYTFEVCLTGKALRRYPAGSDLPIRVRSFADEKMWLSIALLDWHLQ